MNPFILNYLISHDMDRDGKPNKPEPKAAQSQKTDSTAKKDVSEKKQ